MRVAPAVCEIGRFRQKSGIFGVEVCRLSAVATLRGLPRVRGSPDSKPGERWALRSRPSFPAVVSWSADFSLPLRRCSRSCSGFPSVALLRSGLTNRVGVVASGRLRPLFCPLALPHRRAVSGGNPQTSPFCPLRCALLAFVGRSGMFTVRGDKREICAVSVALFGLFVFAFRGLPAASSSLWVSCRPAIAPGVPHRRDIGRGSDGQPCRGGCACARVRGVSGCRSAPAVEVRQDCKAIFPAQAGEKSFYPQK